MRRPTPIASGWFQGAILTYLFGFTVLGILAFLTYYPNRSEPPAAGGPEQPVRLYMIEPTGVVRR